MQTLAHTLTLGAALLAATVTHTPAAQHHATYRVHTDLAGLHDATAHQETAGRARFTGTNPWDRTKAAGLADGTWRAQYEDVATTTATTLDGVQSWLDAPYHRFSVLDANNWAVACATATASANGQTQTAQVLELVSTWKPQVRKLTVYPAANQTAVPHQLRPGHRAPQPVPRCRW